MRILHILPLIPLAAAEYGYWNFTAYVSFPASGYTSWGINAVYYNSELSEPIAVNCSYLYTPPTHNATESCTSEGFSYDLGGIRKLLLLLLYLFLLGLLGCGELKERREGGGEEEKGRIGESIGDKREERREIRGQMLIGKIGMANTISNVTLKQTVPLWGEQVTIMGSKAFKWDFSGGSGRYGDVNGTIEVTEAIA